MTAAESRGVQVEARTLSGVHLGMAVTVPEQWSSSEADRWTGFVRHVAHQDERTAVRLWHPRRGSERGWVQTYDLAPTDLVTLTDGGAEG